MDYRLYSAQPLLKDVIEATRKRISFFLSLDDDLAPFYEIANTDKYFAPIVRRLYGLHHVKFPSLAEAACWAILTQRQAIPVARQIKRRLVERYGSHLTVNGVDYWAFPELAQLARLSEQELTDVIKDQRRAGYLHGLVKALGEVDEEWLRTAPYEEAEQWLRTIKGVGEWSAGLILLRALGRMERMAMDLKPFLKIMPEVYGPNVNMKELAAYYGNWFGYWGYYMRVGN